MYPSFYPNRVPEETSFCSLLEQLSGAVDVKAAQVKSVDVTKKMPPRSVTRPDLLSDTFRQNTGAADHVRGNEPHAVQAADPGRTSRAKVAAIDPRVADPHATDPDLEETAPAAALSDARQQLRSTVLSVRLNERELTLLRDRAAESGISVSGYIRSCVVDADQLRIQVKQVLASLRSQTGLQGKKLPPASDVEEKGSRRRLGASLAAALRSLFTRPHSTWIAD